MVELMLQISADDVLNVVWDWSGLEHNNIRKAKEPDKGSRDGRK